MTKKFIYNKWFLTKTETNLLVLPPVHSSPAKLRWLESIVEIPLAFRVSKEEDLQMKTSHNIISKFLKNTCCKLGQLCNNGNFAYLRVPTNKPDTFARVYLRTTGTAYLEPAMQRGINMDLNKECTISSQQAVPNF